MSALNLHIHWKIITNYLKEKKTTDDNEMITTIRK